MIGFIQLAVFLIMLLITEINNYSMFLSVQANLFTSTVPAHCTLCNFPINFFYCLYSVISAVFSLSMDSFIFLSCAMLDFTVSGSFHLHNNIVSTTFSEIFL